MRALKVHEIANNEKLGAVRKLSLLCSFSSISLCKESKNTVHLRTVLLLA